MREIKFRIYSTELENHFYNFGILGGVLFIAFDKEKPSYFDIIVNYEDVKNLYIIEQYTGLKDKNGKDIYEGDIIKFQDREYDDIYGVGNVCYDNDDCLFKVRCKGIILFFINMLSEELEVVGNIHEKEKANE